MKDNSMTLWGATAFPKAVIAEADLDFTIHLSFVISHTACNHLLGMDLLQRISPFVFQRSAT